MKSIYLLCFLFLTSYLNAQTPALDLLNKSIAFHDPYNNWDSFNASLNFVVERPDKPNGERLVLINNLEKSFSFFAHYDSDVLNYEVSNNIGQAKWNGVEEVSDSIAKQYRISDDRALMYRDYYTYLYGMPMKLKDPGTLIDPEVKEVEFFGKTYNRIRVSYDPKVGDDIWYFYFDPNTSALEAYQFYHDEAKQDGEYILFEEIKVLDRVKIPRIRKWYYNSDSTYLAADILK